MVCGCVGEINDRLINKITLNLIRHSKKALCPKNL